MRIPGTAAVLATLLLSSMPGVDAAADAPTMTAQIVVDGQLSSQAVPLPQPGPGQVRVRVKAASVNPVDLKLAARAQPGVKSIPGRDFAGVIDAVGPEVTQWKVGDAVFGFATGGAYAQFTLADAGAIARKPSNLSFEESAGIPVVGGTAWRAIVVVGDVQKGQRVLIQGGAGGVGSSAVQIAKARGAYVIATASARHSALLKSLGADEVIDYTAVKFEDKVRDLDLVFNTVDADTGVRSIGVLRKGGLLVSAVGLPPAQLCEAAGVRCQDSGRFGGDILPRLAQLAEAGQYHISVEKALPLAQATAAWAESHAGHVGGKIILIP